MLSSFIAHIRDLSREQVEQLTEEECVAFKPPRNWPYKGQLDEVPGWTQKNDGYYTPDDFEPEVVFTAKEAVVAWFSNLPPQYPSPEWIDLVLSYDMFQGDVGDGSERTLRDEIRVAKRGGKCSECKQKILKGEVVRVIKKVDGDGFYGGRCCRLCCDAMALSDVDGGDSIEFQWDKGSREPIKTLP